MDKISSNIKQELKLFLDAQASLAPTHVCLSVGPLVRWSHFWIYIAAEHFCATVVFDVN